VLFPAVTAVQPLELWAGGRAVWIGGRHFKLGHSWRDVAAGSFSSPGPVKVRCYLGIERGFFVCVGDWYYAVSWFSGRPSLLLPGEQVPTTLYPNDP
jgi:hypothetical protein